MARIRQALVSVSDKSGVIELCKKLVGFEVQILSTGGTARALRDAGVEVTDVSEYTGSPEVMDGRVKTLHPRVHGAILMRDTANDHRDLARIGGHPIDLVVCNLYAFEASVTRGAAHDEVLENIDIGGPCMIRAAAKNHTRVGVVVDPADYDRVASRAAEGLDPALRLELATKAFAHTAAYDRAISDYFARKRLS